MTYRMRMSPSGKALASQASIFFLAGSSPVIRSSDSNVSPSIYAKGGEIFLYIPDCKANRRDGEPIVPYNLELT